MRGWPIVLMWVSMGAGALAVACGSGRTLRLPDGNVSESQYRAYVRNLLRNGDGVNFCVFVRTLDPLRTVEAVNMPDDVQPRTSGGPVDADIDRAKAIVERECNLLTEQTMLQSAVA